MLVEKRQYFIRIAAVLVILSSLTTVFANFGYDGEYQIAMGLRLLQGDRPILQMWEPHQTSAFAVAALMRIYLAITGTATGIVLYLQVVGFLIRVFLAWLLYRLFCTCTEWETAFCAAMLYLLVSPKEMALPEFGNLQLWFGTCLFLALARAFRLSEEGTSLGETRKFDLHRMLWLVAAAVFLCLEVLAYPSSLVVYFSTVVLILRYSKGGWRDFALFTAVCAIFGGLVCLHYLHGIEWETARSVLTATLAIEPSHTAGMGEKLLGYLKNLGMIALMLAGDALLGGIIASFASLIRKGRGRFVSIWAACSWLVLMVFFLWNSLVTRFHMAYAVPLIGICILGFFCRKRLSAVERRLYRMTALIGGGGMLAALILSDHPFLPDVPYALLWICGSLLPIGRAMESLGNTGSDKRIQTALILTGKNLFFLILCFRTAYWHIPMMGYAQVYTLRDDFTLIRTGPAAGMITDDMGGGAAEGQLSRVGKLCSRWGQNLDLGRTCRQLGLSILRYGGRGTVRDVDADLQRGTSLLL